MKNRPVRPEELWSVIKRTSPDRLIVEHSIQLYPSELRDAKHCADIVMERVAARFDREDNPWDYLFREWKEVGKRRARRALIKIFREYLRSLGGMG